MEDFASMFLLYYLILENNCLKTTEANNKLSGPQSCTSVKEAWGTRKWDVDSKPIMQTTVECAKGENECKKMAIKCILYEAKYEVA